MQVSTKMNLMKLESMLPLTQHEVCAFVNLSMLIDIKSW